MRKDKIYEDLKSLDVRETLTTKFIKGEERNEKKQ